MKYLVSLIGLCLSLLFIVKNHQSGSRGEEVKEMIPTANPTICLCFEYYNNNLSEEERTIYQTCEIEALDYVEDQNFELFVIDMPCDSVYEGVRVLSAVRQYSL